MPMRVTEKMMTDNAIGYMSDSLSLYNELSERTASGKKFSRASDDPSAAVASLKLSSTIATNEGYKSTTDTTSTWMAVTDDALQSMMDIAIKAKSLTQGGLSDTEGADERKAQADELDVLLQEAIDLGNTKYQDSYIFAGFSVTTTPFSGVDNNADGLYDQVDYNGDDGTILRTVGPGQTIAQNINGDTAFSTFLAGIIQARDALYASDTTAAETALATLQTGITNMNTATTTNGARLRQVESIGERLDSTKTELASLLSQNEDVNMAEAISKMSSQETVYQAVLEVGQRTLSALNLFQMLG